MKRAICISLFFCLFLHGAVSIEKAIVNDNRVNVRNSTIIEPASVLYQLDAGEVIFIYETFGDGTYKNSIYNLWYNISNEKTEYINALHVNTFPFSTKVFEESPEGTVEYYNVIRDCKYDEGKLYFYGSFYYGFYHRNYNSVKHDIWIEADKIDWVGNKTKNIGEFFSSLRHTLQEQFLLIPTSIETRGTKRIIKTYHCNTDSIDAVIEIGGLVDNHLQLLVVKDPNVLLPFGISLGMQYEDLIDVFGAPHEENGDTIKYELGCFMVNTVTFQIKNNKIASIRFESTL